nr:hypothetical protein [Klebsiella pneumoniae]
MNDIELAQSLKRRATSANEFGESLYVKADDVLALVEALEKAQQQMTESENRVRKQNRHICELFDDNTALRKRIAELESRTVTVKLASRRLPSDYVDGEFGNDDLAAIHNACRLECKVSVEKYLSAHGIVVKWEDE